MFTGIVEEVAKIVGVTPEKGNIHIEISSRLASELKVDQSVAHNGVCLTITGLASGEGSYTVTAVAETLKKTNLGILSPGHPVNLERALRVGDRLDGHMVQGHIDQTAKCVEIAETGGSWLVTFEYDASLGNITVEKGSIAVNGVSLTVVKSAPGRFLVALIPYTWEHTTFRFLQTGDVVNLEFDMLGKYVHDLVKRQIPSAK